MTALKILGIWIAFDLFVFLPLWIAAHGGLRDGA
jgi:hypothetical protein